MGKNPTWGQVNDLRSKIIEQNATFLQDKLFMEFGVFDGDSIENFYHLYRKHIPNYSKKLYGFDSFYGLPKEENDKNNPSYWRRGEFYAGGNIPEHLKKDQYTIIKGWFNDVLTPEFAESLREETIGLLHVDCDIYTSAYQVLDFCFGNNLMTKGSIIVYDDWAGYHEKLGEGHDFEAGEGLAHAQIMNKYNRTCTFAEKLAVIPEQPQQWEIAVFIVN